ncbi:ABC transporter ATP-binding protein [Mesorhizobium sp. B2-6-5]|uniref:ABC transporter ATP-binding protein n=1 Tax=Mesorhizobium sp. B2-6-5 TaxID=2589912 RepID=UPI0015E46503|nr:ABC transporter ATP-binding protein [Mesorhizobium sp. B2-6-5]
MKAVNEAPVDVRLSEVSKSFGNQPVLRRLSLEIRKGEVLGLLGPSGCGKTTLLRMIAGLETPDEGSVEIGGSVMDGVPVHKRNIGMLFQNYALFPHLNVEQNIAFGLRMRRREKTEIQAAVRQAMDLIRLPDIAKRRPSELSGGQRQRVALARAIVGKPAVLLLDEPLAALDKKLRAHMQVEIRELQRRLGLTTVFVTHDQEEALVLSDRVAVMDRGEILQLGSADDVYERPATTFVSDFLGVSNQLTGVVTKAEGGDITVNCPDGRLDLIARSDAVQRGTAVKLAIRPEHLQISQARIDRSNSYPAAVEATIYRGNFIDYHLRVNNGPALIATVSTHSSHGANARHEVGDRVYVGARPENVLVFCEP